MLAGSSIKLRIFFNLKPDTILCAHVTQISVLGDLGGRDLDEVIPDIVAFVGGCWRPRSVCVGNLGKSHLGNQRSLPLFIVSSMHVLK